MQHLGDGFAAFSHRIRDDRVVGMTVAVAGIGMQCPGKDAPVGERHANRFSDERVDFFIRHFFCFHERGSAAACSRALDCPSAQRKSRTPAAKIPRMPFVQVHTSRALSGEARRNLGLALARVYGEAMQTSHRIVNVGFVYYAEGDLARYDAAEDAPSEMTIVTCDVRAGRSPTVQEALARAIAAACARGLDISEARVAVYLSEHPAYQIYRDGGRAPDWSPSEAVRP